MSTSSTPSPLNPVPRARLGYWVCQVIGWALWCVAGLFMARQQAGMLTSQIITGYALFFVYAISLSHLWRRIIRRRGWLTLPPARALPRLAAGALAFGLVLSALVVLVSFVQRGSGSDFDHPASLVMLAVNLTFATAIWTTLYAGLGTWLQHREARLQAAALERSLGAARFQALEAQISPHFLFNCLNSLRGMIAEDPKMAQDMVTRLANILRHNLTRSPETPTEPLATQLEVVSDYLALEAVRFDERLRVRLDVDPAAGTCPVPAMSLQTLVENALKHGIAHLPDGGEVAIIARVDNGQLDVMVENSGTLRPAGSSSHSTQVGLANLRERMRLLYGKAGSFELDTLGSDRVRARLRVPARLPAAAAAAPART